MRTAHFATRSMGSAVRLTVLGAAPAQARAAREAAWGELAATEDELTRFRPESELSRANLHAGSGIRIRPTARLRALIATAERARRTTRGRFDARVVGALEAIGERSGIRVPPAGPRDRPAATVHGRGVIELLAPIDSGGLGKGLGLRWAIAAARRAAPTAGGILLEAGGDIAATGRGPLAGSWSIGIEDPLHTDGAPLAAFRLEGDAAVATSSVAVRRWTHEGGMVHHLIDPATGRSADTDLLAVTVLASDPAWAEVRTKSLFIAGRAVIGDEARAAGWAAWWVEGDGSLHMTPAARAVTLWTAEDARSA